MPDQPQTTDFWSIADPDGNCLDAQIVGEMIDLSMIEAGEDAMVIDLSATRPQMRAFANWILQNV